MKPKKQTIHISIPAPVLICVGLFFALVRRSGDDSNWRAEFEFQAHRMQ